MQCLPLYLCHLLLLLVLIPTWACLFSWWSPTCLSDSVHFSLSLFLPTPDLVISVVLSTSSLLLFSTCSYLMLIPPAFFLFQLLCISAWEFLKFRISYVIFLISFSYLPMFLFSHLNIKTFTLNIFFRDRFCGNEFPQNCFVPFNESSHFLFFVKCNFVFLFLLLLKTEYLNLKI